MLGQILERRSNPTRALPVAGGCQSWIHQPLWPPVTHWLQRNCQQRPTGDIENATETSCKVISIHHGQQPGKKCLPNRNISVPERHSFSHKMTERDEFKKYINKTESKQSQRQNQKTVWVGELLGREEIKVRKLSHLNKLKPKASRCTQFLNVPPYSARCREKSTHSVICWKETSSKKKLRLIIPEL